MLLLSAVAGGMPTLDTIHHCEVLTFLRALPSNYVNCIVTSPPYFGLRDYGADGQIGLESSPQAFIARLVEVFRECHRVLRDDGVLWLNMGDSYAGSWGNYAPTGKGGQRVKNSERWQRYAYVGKEGWRPPTSYQMQGFKPKDLMGIPWRLAFALQDDGWYLRSDIVWSKNNPMPESVRDRPTKSHEYIFMLTKKPRYWYDSEAIKEASVSDHPSGNGYKRNERLSYQDAEGPRGSNEQWQIKPTRNARSVWTINTQPFAEAHFATFPEELVRRCLLASCPDKVCSKCGKPWKRVIERTGHVNRREPTHTPNHQPTKVDSTGWAPTTRATDDWQPTCACEAETRPGIVLDPFMGAGTVGVVAALHGRHYLGCDLNAEYVGMARKRIQTRLDEQKKRKRQADPFQNREVAPGITQISMFATAK